MKAFAWAGPEEEKGPPCVTGGKAAPSRTEGQPRFSRLPTLGCTDLNRLPFSLGTTPAARKWDRSANVRS